MKFLLLVAGCSLLVSRSELIVDGFPWNEEPETSNEKQKVERQ